MRRDKLAGAEALLRWSLAVCSMAVCSMAAGCDSPRLGESEDCHNFALQFSGAQFLDVGYAPDLGGYKPVTVEAWVRVEPPFLETGMDLLAHYIIKPIEAAGWQLAVGLDATVRFAFYDTVYHITGVSGGMLDDTWTHVAVSLPLSQSGLGAIYLNGLKVGEGAARAPLSYVGPLRIGSSNLGTRGFHGLIDEVRISRSSRYDGDFAVPREPFSTDEETVALWHFDEGEGPMAADETGAHPASMPLELASQPAWMRTPCIRDLRP